MPENEHLAPPLGGMDPGTTPEKIEQRDFYRILRDKRKMPQKCTTDKNVAAIQDALQETSNKRPTTERVWLATKHKGLTRKRRDFIWKSIQGTYKIGAFWSRVDGYEEHAVCPNCDKREDMDYILLRCRAEVRETAWNSQTTSGQGTAKPKS